SMGLIPMGGHKIAPNATLMDCYPDVYLSTGLVAENHAREAGITREEQDAYALRSHNRAVLAIDQGRFAEEIVPVPASIVGYGVRHLTRGQESHPVRQDLTFATDEGPRRDTSVEALGKLRPVFHMAGSLPAGK